MKTDCDMADDLIKGGDYKAALRSYLEILEHDPNDAKVYQGIAQCQYRLKNYDNAITDCNKAIELDPNLAIPHITLANIYHRRHDLNKAFTEALNAYELSPELEEVINCYGAMLLEKGRIEESISVLNRALEINPTFAAAHYNLAIAYRRRGNHKKLVEEMKTFFKYKPSLRHGFYVVWAYEQRYTLIIIIVVLAALFGSIFVKSKILLVIPLIFVIQSWLIAYDNFKRGQWRNGLLYLLTDIPIVLLIYYFYVALTPR